MLPSWLKNLSIVSSVHGKSVASGSPVSSGNMTILGNAALGVVMCSIHLHKLVGQQQPFELVPKDLWITPPASSKRSVRPSHAIGLNADTNLMLKACMLVLVTVSFARDGLRFFDAKIGDINSCLACSSFLFKRPNLKSIFLTAWELAQVRKRLPKNRKGTDETKNDLSSFVIGSRCGSRYRTGKRSAQAPTVPH